MRKNYCCYVILFLIIIIVPTQLLAQSDNQKSDLVLVEDITIKSSMRTEFEKITKELVTLYKEIDFPYQFTVFYSFELHYIFLFPFNNHSDIDNIWAEAGKLHKDNNYGEKFTNLMSKFMNCTDNIKLTMLQRRVDLSYYPDEHRLKKDEVRFLNWDIMYIHPEKQMEFEKVLKEWRDLVASKNIPQQVDSFMGGVGWETPVFIGSAYGKSASDFYAINENLWDQLGEHGKELLKKGRPLHRKREVLQGVIRPDLSYIVEK